MESLGWGGHHTHHRHPNLIFFQHPTWCNLVPRRASYIFGRPYTQARPPTFLLPSTFFITLVFSRHITHAYTHTHTLLLLRSKCPGFVHLFFPFFFFSFNPFSYHIYSRPSFCGNISSWSSAVVVRHLSCLPGMSMPPTHSAPSHPHPYLRPPRQV